MIKSPRQFSALINRAIVKQLVPSRLERKASSKAVAAVMLAVHAAAAAGEISFQGQAVKVDRIAMAGSYGKKTSVMGQFDVDLVAFFNPPTTGSIAVKDPDKVQRQLQSTLSRLENFLNQHLPDFLSEGKVMQLGQQVEAGSHRMAIPLELMSAGQAVEVDLVLAPNLAIAKPGSADDGLDVVHLFLKILLAIQEMSQSAAASARGCHVEPIMFTESQAAVFYTRQQALQLQELLLVTSPSKAWDACRGQPVLVHPIDPLFNVFDQRPYSRPFELWQQFGEAALQLQTDLQECSWGYITSKSSLAAVFAE
eukprot:gene11640-11785_t